MTAPADSRSTPRWPMALLAIATLLLVAATVALAIARPASPLLGPLIAASCLGTLIALATVHLANRPVTSDAARLRETLERIDEHLSLSDTARRFVYREQELEMLKLTLERDIEAGHFEAALRVVEELGRGYGLLEEADAQRTRIEAIRGGQVRRRIDEGLQRIRTLVGNGDWSLASRAAERLQVRFPDASETQDLTNQIAAARHRYAAELEERVRGAVHEQRIEEAMQGLRELDRLLVGDEIGRMADVAQTIIVAHREHCGRTFREAVARHDWSGALTIGELITTDYPNTRMAEEVRELLPGIRWRVDPSGQPPPGDGSSGEVAATPGND